MEEMCEEYIEVFERNGVKYLEDLGFIWIDNMNDHDEGFSVAVEEWTSFEIPLSEIAAEEPEDRMAYVIDTVAAECVNYKGFYPDEEEDELRRSYFGEHDWNPIRYSEIDNDTPCGWYVVSY